MSVLSHAARAAAHHGAHLADDGTLMVRVSRPGLVALCEMKETPLPLFHLGNIFNSHPTMVFKRSLSEEKFGSRNVARIIDGCIIEFPRITEENAIDVLITLYVLQEAIPPVRSTKAYAVLCTANRTFHVDLVAPYEARVLFEYPSVRTAAQDQLNAFIEHYGLRSFFKRAEVMPRAHESCVLIDCPEGGKLLQLDDRTKRYTGSFKFSLGTLGLYVAGLALADTTAP